ncbi:MAG: tRNA (adenosine(37)-N6)-threonylcarbamoyltransferase complex transferase subunit TsaD [Bdellovibrionales bacterium]
MSKIVLGMETSCDETAVALVSQSREILAHNVFSQIQTHKEYGGVVPEVAAREHLDRLDDMIKKTMSDANMAYEDLSAVAATSGPGLIGGVMVGMMAGKTISAIYDKPFIAINHLAAHVLTPRLTEDISFPYLALLVSGGHTQFLLVRGIDDMVALGTTIDDALGEAFDKTAKMMGLPYPGGPYIEQLARKCVAPEEALKRFPLPKPLYRKKGCDFSFSGLKTAIGKYIEEIPEGKISSDDAHDLAYAFQHVIVEVIKDRLDHAIIMARDIADAPLNDMVIVGGVAANRFIYEGIQEMAERHDLRCVTPPLKLCTDNGAMIAWAGVEYLQKGITHPLSFPARPRWPLSNILVA